MGRLGEMHGFKSFLFTASSMADTVLGKTLGQGKVIAIE